MTTTTTEREYQVEIRWGGIGFLTEWITVKAFSPSEAKAKAAAWAREEKRKARQKS